MKSLKLIFTTRVGLMNKIKALESHIEHLNVWLKDNRDEANKYADLYYAEVRMKGSDIRRFEAEVIHLKDVIQEKNMVIDRLLEKNKSFDK